MAPKIVPLTNTRSVVKARKFLQQQNLCRKTPYVHEKSIQGHIFRIGQLVGQMNTQKSALLHERSLLQSRYENRRNTKLTDGKGDAELEPTNFHDSRSVLKTGTAENVSVE